jgi:hypothetical protein
MSFPVFAVEKFLRKFPSDRRSFLKASVVVLGTGTLVHAQDASAVNAAVVNRSARMRALSQRLVKLKTQQFLQINPDATSDSIVATEKLMSSHLQFLSSSVPLTSRARVDNLGRLVDVLMAQAKVVPTRESLIETNAKSMDVLKAADELTVEMQSLSKVKAVAIVAARADNKEAVTRIAEDRKLFSEAMKQLADSPVADAKVKQEHANLASRYKKYEELIGDASDKGMNKAHLASIATLSEQVLASAHELTVLFEDALKSKNVAGKTRVS